MFYVYVSCRLSMSAVPSVRVPRHPSERGTAVQTRLFFMPRTAVYSNYQLATSLNALFLALDSVYGKSTVWVRRATADGRYNATREHISKTYATLYCRRFAIIVASTNCISQPPICFVRRRRMRRVSQLLVLPLCW